MFTLYLRPKGRRDGYHIRIPQWLWFRLDGTGINLLGFPKDFDGTLSKFIPVFPFRQVSNPGNLWLLFIRVQVS